MATGFAQAGVVFVTKGLDKFLNSFKRVNDTTEKLNKNIDKSVEKWNRFESNLRTQADSISSRVLPNLVIALTAVVVALGAISSAGISTAASFENAFADVTKTVDAFVDRAATAEAGVIQLTEAGQQFRDDLKALSFEIPVAFEELSAIAGLGGQLGVIEGLGGEDARIALLRFTETVAGLGEATNLTQQKAATGLAQISNIYRESVDNVGENVERLGSTIVELGNTSAATESLILNFSQRIAGAGQTIGLTQAEVLGIGTAFASIGITAEAGSTAVNRALLIMNEAVANSTDKFLDNTTAIDKTIEEISSLQADLVTLEAQTGISGESLRALREEFLAGGGAAEDFGRELGDTRRKQLFETQVEVDRLIQKLNQLRVTQGQAVTTEVFDELLRVVQQTQKGAALTAESFRELFVDDPAEAFTLFVEGLAEEGVRAGETLDAIGLGSVEATRAFLAMSGASDLVRDRVLAATEAFMENSALADEVSIRYATLKSNFEEFINVVRGVTDTLFSPLIDPAIKLVEWGKEVVLVFGEEIPKVFEALVNKFGPELQEIFDELFGPGLTIGGEITTPEGFTLSGEAIGLEPESVSALKASFDGLQESIDALDVSGLSDKVIAVRDTIVPIWNTAMTLATENTNFLIGAVKGLATIIGGTLLISAVSKAVTALGFLTTPLGQLSLLALGLNIAWETNFLGIKEITETIAGDITLSLDRLQQRLGEFSLGDLFGGIDIGFDFPAWLDRSAESLGNLTSLVITTPIDQLEAFAEFIQGIIEIITAEDLPTAISGLETAVSGFVDALTAPLQNLAEFLGIDTSEFISTIKEFGVTSALNFVEGFISGLTGTDLDLGDNLGELFTSLRELGESPGIQVFLAGLQQMGEGLVDLFEAFGGLGLAIKELVGLKPDDSLIRFIGSIAGFAASIGIESLMTLVEGLTGLVITLDGLASLDSERISEGLSKIGEAITNFVLIPFSRIADVAGPEFKLQMAQLALDAIASFQDSWDKNLKIPDMGPAIAEWATSFSETLGNAIDTTIQSIQGLFSQRLVLDLELPEMGENIAEWATKFSDTLGEAIDTTIQSIQGLFSQRLVLDLDLEFAIPEALEFFTTVDSQIDLWVENTKEKLTLTLDIESLDFFATLESIRTNIVTWATDLATDVKDLLSGIWDFLIPDISILRTLSDLGIIDLDLDVNTTGIGEDLAQGLVDGVEESEEKWQDAWLNFLLSPIDSSKEALGIKSPSTVTEAIARDVVAGYVVGLSDLTPLEEAIIGVDTTILNAFRTLSTEITNITKPSLQGLDEQLELLHSDTLPRTTSSLVDELIPAKVDLADVNLNELIPSIDALIEVEEELEAVFKRVNDLLRVTVDLKKEDKSKSKDLIIEIDKLTEAYLKLASAIEDVAEAGSNVPSVTPSPPTTTEPAGIPFQSGGSFIVPQNVGPSGMPLTVHAGELVQIIPSAMVQQIQQIPSMPSSPTVHAPSLTGAPISNMITEQVHNSEIKEFHLHVQEAPTSDVRDSFELLETLS